MGRLKNQAQNGSESEIADSRHHSQGFTAGTGWPRATAEVVPGKSMVLADARSGTSIVLPADRGGNVCSGREAHLIVPRVFIINHYFPFIFS